VKVLNRKGIAHQTGPESSRGSLFVAHREMRDEALTREPAMESPQEALRALFSSESGAKTLRPTMKTFENKNVIITGGTSGIGKATALAFAKEGANVVVSGRRVAEGEEVAGEITAAGGRSMFVQTDVS
jgi:hypothetical protein